MLRKLLVAIPLAALVLSGCAAGVETADDKPEFSEQEQRAAAKAKKELSQDPDPVPSPDGTFSGSCDYTLPVDIDGDYTLIGDVEAVNTGNVGIAVKVTVKWLQMGYDPVTASETLRVKPGRSKTARFNKVVSGTVLDRVQSYQLNHTGEQSCEYRGVMVDTFGQPQE